MTTFIRLLIILIVSTGVSACRHQLLNPRQNETIHAVESVIRVTVTSQGYHFHRPWQQRRPVTQTAIGAIVPGGRVLVTAMLVVNHRYIELETIDTQEKQPAEVAVVDYEANLALLKPVNEAFLAGRRPLTLAKQILPGDNLAIWQVKPDGDVLPATGQVTSIELSAYTSNNFFLAYRLNNALQYAFNNRTLPVVKGAQLAGLVLRYNADSQSPEVIAVPVIRHFLEDTDQDAYRGFPRAGFHYGPALDPQLRRYIGLPEDQTGIYVQKVIKGGPADQAGLEAGDVITRLGDFRVSNTGQYDHPQYGKTSLVHLIRTVYQVGDSVPFQVFRKDQLMTLNVRLNHRKPDEYLVPPYIIDRPPDYLIMGGLVFQELSVSYLREYGNEWALRAPIHLLFYNQNQDYLNGDHREKIVIISNVIPTPFTIGYENLTDLVVEKVNGRPIGKLSDVVQAFNTAIKGFHKIEVEQHPRVLFLDPQEIPRIHQVIRERYRIPVSSPF